MDESGRPPDPNGTHVLLDRPFDLESLGAVRSAVRGLVMVAGVDAERAQSFTFAVNEGMINAIMHGGGGGDVSLLRSGRRLVAVVEDHVLSEPFTLPGIRPEPDAVGGRGLWLIAQSCDEARLEAGKRGLRLVLELALPDA